jgi:hypothetical protein
MRSHTLEPVNNDGRIGVLGFRNDPKAILVGLILALIIIVFAPALKWIVWRFPFSKQSLRISYIEMSVPRSWIVKQNGNPVGAWKPCMTIICTPPTASFQVAVNKELAGSDDAWLLATMQAFEEGHYSPAMQVEQSWQALVLSKAPGLWPLSKVRKVFYLSFTLL